ncbi:MAG: hypothetical protein ACRCYY_03365 [Trueperaceae bacterium]
MLKVQLSLGSSVRVVLIDLLVLIGLGLFAPLSPTYVVAQDNKQQDTKQDNHKQNDHKQGDHDHDDHDDNDQEQNDQEQNDQEQNDDPEEGGGEGPGDHHGPGNNNGPQWPPQIPRPPLPNWPQPPQVPKPPKPPSPQPPVPQPSAPPQPHSPQPQSPVPAEPTPSPTPDSPTPPSEQPEKPQNGGTSSPDETSNEGTSGNLVGGGNTNDDDTNNAGSSENTSSTDSTTDTTSNPTTTSEEEAVSQDEVAAVSEDNRLYYVGTVSAIDGSSLLVDGTKLQSTSRWVEVLTTGMWLEAYGNWQEDGSFFAEELNVLAGENWAYIRAPALVFNTLEVVDPEAQLEVWTSGENIELQHEVSQTASQDSVRIVAYFDGTMIHAVPQPLLPPVPALETGWVEFIGYFDGDGIVWESSAVFP